MSNRELLLEIAEAVFGPRWQNATARALGLNTRQIHRWVSGQYEPSDEVIREMINIAETQVGEIERAVAKARKALSRRSKYADLV